MGIAASSQIIPPGLPSNTQSIDWLQRIRNLKENLMSDFCGRADM
jgi:hypothetical protein